jgi:hypothetical protein
MTVVGLDKVPDAIRIAADLPDADYADVVTAPKGAATATPEEWARAALEHTPTGRSAPSFWRTLGLRLGPRPSPDHIQGWRIGGRGEDWLRIETASRIMTAHAVVHVDASTVSLGLFVRFDHPSATVIWPPVGVMHRRVVPVMLHQALRHLTG